MFLIACLTTRRCVRKENSAINTQNLTEWAKDFVKHVEPKGKDGRKVMLTFDGQSSHITLSVLRILKDVGFLA